MKADAMSLLPEGQNSLYTFHNSGKCSCDTQPIIDFMLYTLSWQVSHEQRSSTLTSCDWSRQSRSGNNIDPYRFGLVDYGATETFE